jgi:tetratricopeptide (TPR) repeat protein
MSVQKITPPAPFMANEPIETFVGREQDLEELHHIIANRGISAITGKVGTGGIGKTELARMYAKRYRDEYPAGVFWASLNGSTWQEEAYTILKALYPGADITPFLDNGSAKDEVSRQLSRKEALLVIDNVNEADEIIRPGCLVLVTTRDKKAFGIISRIAIKELGRLSGDDGINLLMKVLGKTRVARDPFGASRIVEILGGMPLALAIAAYHLEAVPNLNFPDYLGQIQEKIIELKLKDDEDRGVAASLELSLGQLGSIPRGARLLDLFEAASVCAESGFAPLTLAEAAGLEEKDQKTAEELRQRSLLEYDHGLCRYSMHPLLRKLAETRLIMDENRGLAYRENHCMHFLRFVEEHTNSPDMLISERGGLWQAMLQTRQTRREKELLPHFLEHFIQPFRQLTARKDYEGAFSYLVAAGLINMNNLGLVNDLELILQVLAQNQAALKEPSRAWVYTRLGNVSIRLGEYEKAIEFYEKALDIYHMIGDAQGEGNALGNMGNASIRLGERDKAFDVYEKAREIYHRIGDASGEGKVLGNMGDTCADLGECAKAISFYEKQLEIHRRIGYVLGEGNALGNMGLAYLDLGEYRRAIGFYRKQLEITRRTGDAQSEGNALGNMGIAYASLNEYAKAIGFYEKQLEIHRRIGYVLGEGNALGNMGLAYAKIGMHEEAHRCFEASSVIFHGLGLKDVVVKIEEMMKNAEHWILRNDGYGWGKWTSSPFPGKKTPNKKLKP